MRPGSAFNFRHKTGAPVRRTFREVILWGCPSWLQATSRPFLVQGNASAYLRTAEIAMIPVRFNWKAHSERESASEEPMDSIGGSRVCLVCGCPQ